MNNFQKEQLSFWQSLTSRQMQTILDRVKLYRYDFGRMIRLDSERHSGIKIIYSGPIRVFITSDEEEEVNLYRLISGNVCIFSI